MNESRGRGFYERAKGSRGSGGGETERWNPNELRGNGDGGDGLEQAGVGRVRADFCHGEREVWYRTLRGQSAVVVRAHSPLPDKVPPVCCHSGRA